MITPFSCRFELLSSAFVFNNAEADSDAKKMDGKIKEKVDKDEDSGSEDEDRDEDDDDDEEDSGDEDDDGDEDEEDDSEIEDDDEDDDDDENKGEREGGDSSVAEDLSSVKIQSLYTGDEEWRYLTNLPSAEG